MREPIAIIGMGCRFPGGANDPDSFWQLLINEVDAIIPMPSGRFNTETYYNPVPATPGKIVTREGGFLQNIDLFDADFFNISPYEATYMDPQQRLLLEVSWEALESAGLVPARLAGSNTGVFVGMWTNDYEALAYGVSDNIDLYITTGSGRYTTSGRLSYIFDFRGPSMTLDTACSSGLVAVHLACHAIWNGEAQMALAGAANLIIKPEISIGYSRAGMLSPEARCKFGDVSANGYVRSEGVGVLILKLLSQALADGDPVRAIIRGSAVNNDGHASTSLVAPSVDGQIEMLRETYRAAEVDPALVRYVEAHGTGTRVGDPIELKALAAVLGAGRSPAQTGWIGSVKTNFGHTEAASGIAGIIKAALTLERGVIPKSLHFNQPNPNIPWDNLPFRMASQSIPWPGSDERRYAGVNSFGVTGTNAHVVLEAAPPIEGDTAHGTQQPYILPISAHKPGALAELAGKYQNFLAQENIDLDNVIYTASVRRSHHPFRSAFVGYSAAELVEQLAGFEGVSYESTPRKVVFVFPGQGGQWLGMGRQLMETEPVFRAMIERCEQVMQPYLADSLVEAITSQESAALEAIDIVQPAIFAVQVALAELWRSKGVEPAAVIGHSMGEVAAAYVAGSLSLEDAARVICLRSQLMRRVSGKGAMAVVELSLAEAQAALAGYEGQLSVAVNNAPRSVVISGDADALEAVVSQLQSQDVFCRRVKVDVAAHSPHMDALRPELVAALAGIQPNADSIPMYSTVTGEIRPLAEFDAEYWGRNLREPVLFSSAVRQALNDGFNTFIEIGPHPVLLPAIERGLSDYGLDEEQAGSVALIESMRRDEDQQVVMAQAIGRLYSAGYEVEWARLYPAGKVVPLPSFPWQRARYWVDVDPAALTPKRGRAEKKPEAWRDWLYEPRWEAIARSTHQTPAGTWLIFADTRGIGDGLAGHLHQNGAAAVIVRQGTNGVSGDGSYTLDPTQTEAFQQLLTAIPDSLHGVVYLWGADLPPGTDMATDELEAGQRAALGGLLHLAQAMAASRRSARIWIVSRGAQSVHGEETELAPTQATLWGLGRVIREEHPDLWGGLLDLDPDTAADSVEAIWNEIGSTDGEDQLAYRAGGRYALRLVRAESTPPPQPYRFRKDGTYLITGGLGDIGSRIARRMAEQGASRFILMGRTPLPPRSQWRNTPPESERGKKIALVRDLEAAGASVHLAPIDVADESALCAYLEAFEAEGWPPVVGVIHAAGLLDVHLLQQMDWPTMSRVLRPKVLGGLLLHRYLPHVELFVNFSSINALLGLPGQGNYAAANAFLDGLAAYGRAHSRQDLSINWSVWEGLGFASTTSGAGSSAQLAEQGILGFTGEQGVEAFGGLLNWPGANVTVLPADWQKYKLSRSGARQFPMLKHLLDDTAAPRRESVKAGASVVEQLAATEPDKRLDAMGEYLQQVIAQVLKKPSAKVKRTEPLGSYGMNSLMGMELRNRLERDLGITLSATLVWNYPTIDLMSGFLAEKLGLAVDVPAEAASAAETADTPPLDDLIAGLQTLSDDDILRELTGKS